MGFEADELLGSKKTVLREIVIHSRFFSEYQILREISPKLNEMLALPIKRVI